LKPVVDVSFVESLKTMDPQKVDLVIQYALAVAAEAENFKDRELGPIHLIKLVYLADLAYAEGNEGETFSEAPWRFHHFGPWSVEVFHRLGPAAHAIHALERRFPSNYKEEDAFRWKAQEPGLADRLEPKLPLSVVSAVRRNVRLYGTDTTGLLHYVYRTAPMLQAAPGEALDFRPAVEEPVHAPEEHEELPPLPKLSKTKIKNLHALVKRRLKEKQQTETLRLPDPAPRYDEIFEKGQEWLDSMAGTPLKEERGRLQFDDSVWKSPARRDPGIP
jgi:hypothetical protein